MGKELQCLLLFLPAAISSGSGYPTGAIIPELTVARQGRNSPLCGRNVPHVE
jgi:hypothetical protein